MSFDEDEKNDDVIDPIDEEDEEKTDLEETDELDESLDTLPDESIDEDESLLTGAGPSEEELQENVEVANYRITGLVDFTDEQGNIRGQFPKDSIQELPVVVGDKAVEDGQAERVVE